MKFTLDSKTMQAIAMFEQLTGSHVKDCIIADSQVIFVVNEGEIAKAVGKRGQNVRNLESRFKKRVKVVEFSTDVVQFVRNVVAPLELKEVRLEDDKVFMDAKDLKTRGLLIGRGASNLRFFEGIVKRYFPISELRVS